MKKTIWVICVFTLILTAAGYALAATTGYLYPVADGYYKLWNTSPTTSTHYSLVDEINCNSTDYVYVTSSGRTDSYALNISSIPDGSTINRIDVVPCGSSYQAFGVDSKLTIMYRYNKVISTSTRSQLISTTTTVPYLLTTSTWTDLTLKKVATTTIEIVIQNSTAGTSTQRGLKISNLKTIITY